MFANVRKKKEKSRKRAGVLKLDYSRTIDSFVFFYCFSLVVATVAGGMHSGSRRRHSVWFAQNLMNTHKIVTVLAIASGKSFCLRLHLISYIPICEWNHWPSKNLVHLGIQEIESASRERGSLLGSST